MVKHIVMFKLKEEFQGKTAAEKKIPVAYKAFL